MRNNAVLALCLAALLAFAGQAGAAEAVPGDSCATYPANAFQWAGAPENGGVTNGMFCDGTTWDGIINFQNSGNVGIGNTSPGALLDIGKAGTTLGTMRLEGNTSGYVQIQPAAAAGAWTMTLPANAGTNGYQLTTNGAGVLSWAAAGSGGPLSGITAAVAGNTIANANYAQVWNWDTLTTGTALTLASTSLTTGSLLKLTSTSATGASNVLNVSMASTANWSTGILVAATGATGSTFGVAGRTDSTSTSSAGVYGFSTVANSSAFGVWGDLQGANNTGAAVVATNSSATGHALWAGGTSPSYFQGNVGIGTSAPAAVLHLSGGAIIGPDAGSCTAGKKGELRYTDGASPPWNYCNGSAWVPFENCIVGRSWTARDSNRNWQDVASSSDGTKLAAIVYGGQIYTSTDSGATWTARDSNRNWGAIASSSDGTKLVAAVANGGYIYTSINSGQSWTQQTNSGSRVWFDVASSSDGTKLVATVWNGQIYTSTNSGVNWTARDSNRTWSAVASSSDGTKLVALAYSGQIYTSTNSGVNWTARDSSRQWTTVASSSDGTKLIAGANWYPVFTSTDSGVTWTQHNDGTSAAASYMSFASSADGSKIVVISNYASGNFYVSTDSGATWTAYGDLKNWYAVASSSDNTKLVAVVQGGQIYTSSCP